MPFLEAFSSRQNLIEYVSNELIKNSTNNLDLSRYAVVFPGKRPNLYLINRLSERLESAFIPPRMFTITEFMGYVANNNTAEIPLLDAVYEIFKIIKEKQYSLIKDHVYKDFGDFIPWGIEIFKVIEELDVELVNDAMLKALDLPDIPENVITLLSNLPSIKEEFYNRLKQKHLTTRGLVYREASQLIKQKALDEFEHIYFVGLIVLTRAEAEVIKILLKSEKTSFFTQIESLNEPLTINLSKSLDAAFSSYHSNNDLPILNFYKASTTHEEVEYVFSILNDKNINVSKTAIVLPDSATLLPLLSNVMDYLPYDYNVTMGYPLKRTPFYTLINSIFVAQLSSKTDTTEHDVYYYAKDYLSLIKHPYIKGMHRQVVHTIVQQIETYIINKNRAFIKLKELEDTGNKELYNLLEQRLIHIEEPVSIQTVYSYIKEIHELFFKPFESEKLSVIGFAKALDNIISLILKDSSAIKYKFSPSFIKGLMDIIESLKQAEFKKEEFEKQRLFDLFNSYINMQTIPFNGIPLKELQILGLLETRVLNFDTVIVLDCNEGIIPATYRYDPLLPLQIRKTLNLPTYTEQEQIFRYHFRRLIKSAKDVHLIYKENDELEKSRFIEEIIWDEEKKAKKLVKDENETKQLGNIVFNKKQFITKIEKRKKGDIEKDQNIIDTVSAIFSKGVSPTAIDQYMSCPAMFYYSHILGLKEVDTLDEEVEAKEIGVFIHEVLRQFYTGHLHKRYTYHYSDDRKLEDIINTEFERTFHDEDNGVFFLLKEIVTRLLKAFIKEDGERNPHIESLEKELYASVTSIDGFNFRVHGKIDRIDKQDNSYMIIDYKTGGTPKMPKIKEFINRKEPITDRKEMRELIGSFQLPIYMYLCFKNTQELNIDIPNWEYLNASLCIIKEKNNKYKQLFDSEEKYAKQDIIEKLCIPSLGNLIKEILNPDIPFTRDDSDENICTYCPFSMMCK